LGIFLSAATEKGGKII